MKNRKGFTLIELLIVIAIIGILAVAFVPTLLDAPSRGRDSQRVANLNTIRTVLLDADLRGEGLPDTVCIEEDSLGAFLTAFGGAIPLDPQAATREAGEGIGVGGEAECLSYQYIKDPDPNYSIGLYAKMETLDAGNVSCDGLTDEPVNLDAVPADENDSCYAILVQ